MSGIGDGIDDDDDLNGQSVSRRTFGRPRIRLQRTAFLILGWLRRKTLPYPCLASRGGRGFLRGNNVRH